MCARTSFCDIDGINNVITIVHVVQIHILDLGGERALYTLFTRFLDASTECMIRGVCIMYAVGCLITTVLYQGIQSCTFL